jgi:membrane fusion protein (multidrug efflux system)
MKFNCTVFLVTIILLAACQNKKANPQPTPTPPTVVDITIAGLQPISNTVEVNGTVVANEFVELHAETAGKLTYLQVPEGSRIEKGTLIAKVNDADLQAQLNKTNVLLSFAKKTEERNRKLLAINAIKEAYY